MSQGINQGGYEVVVMDSGYISQGLSQIPLVGLESLLSQMSFTLYENFLMVLHLILLWERSRSPKHLLKYVYSKFIVLFKMIMDMLIVVSQVQKTFLKLLRRFFGRSFSVVVVIWIGWDR